MGDSSLQVSTLLSRGSKMSEEQITVIKALLEETFQAGFYEYFSLTVSSVVTLVAVGMSYFFFKNHARQVKNEKVIEKEVEKLYEAVDSLFIFTNASDRFFSMKRRYYLRLLEGNELADGLLTKTQQATDNVYDNFPHAHKAAFILRALGETDVSELVEKYRRDMVEARTRIIEAEEAYDQSEDTAILNALIKDIEQIREKLENDKNDCVDAVANCKKRIKSVA